MTTFTTQDRQDAQRATFKCTCGHAIGHPLVPKCTCKKVLPLTDEQIRDIWYRHPEFKDGLGVEPIEFARAIERAHGIGE